MWYIIVWCHYSSSKSRTVDTCQCLSIITLFHCYQQFLSFQFELATSQWTKSFQDNTPITILLSSYSTWKGALGKYSIRWYNLVADDNTVQSRDLTMITSHSLIILANSPLFTQVGLGPSKSTLSNWSLLIMEQRKAYQITIKPLMESSHHMTRKHVRNPYSSSRAENGAIFLWIPIALYYVYVSLYLCVQPIYRENLTSMPGYAKNRSIRFWFIHVIILTDCCRGKEFRQRWEIVEKMRYMHYL
jgi:hypothetical protein